MTSKGVSGRGGLNSGLTHLPPSLCFVTSFVSCPSNPTLGLSINNDHASKPRDPSSPRLAHQLLPAASPNVADHQA